jgi:hypothetical protein
MSIDNDDDGLDECSTSAGNPAKCTAGLGETFDVRLRLNGLPPGVPTYQGYDAYLRYTGVLPTGDVDFTPWPECAIPAQFMLDFLAFGCGTFNETSTYLGLLAKAEFTCIASGSVVLVHGLYYTDLAEDQDHVYFEPQGSTETLEVNCVAATPTPLPPPAVGGISRDGLLKR